LYKLRIDASQYDGSLGRLVNDDCHKPNANMKVITLQYLPHLCLFALRDINAGDEIRYNYGSFGHFPWHKQVCLNYFSLLKVLLCTVHAQP